MIPEKLKEVLTLSAKTGFVWIATADDKGNPHISVAHNISSETDSIVNLTEWFCPGTVYNLDKNTAISIVVWDRETNNGHQLIGDVVQVNEVGMQDGFTGKSQPAETPQVEREIKVRVGSILEFKNAPHLDRPE